MTAVAGRVGGGGLGDFAITYGYQQFNTVTAAAVLMIVAAVQAVQFLGNWLARAGHAALTARRHFLRVEVSGIAR